MNKSQTFQTFFNYHLAAMQDQGITVTYSDVQQAIQLAENDMKHFGFPLETQTVQKENEDILFNRDQVDTEGMDFLCIEYTNFTLLSDQDMQRLKDIVLYEIKSRLGGDYYTNSVLIDFILFKGGVLVDLGNINRSGSSNIRVALFDLASNIHTSLVTGTRVKKDGSQTIEGLGLDTVISWKLSNA